VRLKRLQHLLLLNSLLLLLHLLGHLQLRQLQWLVHLHLKLLLLHYLLLLLNVEKHLLNLQVKLLLPLRRHPSLYL
jgi:hypothetical protein